LDNNLFVAKALFNIDNGINSVTVDENAAELTAEVERLKLGTWFLDRFKEATSNAQAQIAGMNPYRLFSLTHNYSGYLDFQFVEPLLVREVLSGDVQASPSTASGFNSDQVESSTCGFVYWLIEPRRTPIVTHYNFTLNFQERAEQGIKGRTVAAFVHFAYCYSQKTLVFADVQGSSVHGFVSVYVLTDIQFNVGSLGRDETTQKAVDILFDVMIHSVTG
jgi:hypothetical protein